MSDEKNNNNKNNHNKNNHNKNKDNRYQNRDTGIDKSGKRVGKYAGGNERKSNAKPNTVNGRDTDRPNHSTNQNDNRTRDARDRRNSRNKANRDKKVEDKRNQEARDKKIEGLRKRRKAVQNYTNLAKNDTDPLNKIDWSDKNLKARDRRHLRNILQERGYGSKDIFKKEQADMKSRIRENNKDNVKQGTVLAGNLAGLAGTGGASALLSIPSMVIKAYKIRKNNKSTKALKKSLKWRRILLIIPTLLVVLGLFIAGGLVVATGSQFVGTMLSHPEAIKELYNEGVLGDALYMGNVTEDVVVDGEVIVKGNPEAQPGCFVYNGVWYCGGCLSTGEVQASEADDGTVGNGQVTGELALPIKKPYVVTSNFGMRWGQSHGGIDLVTYDPEKTVMASDGGTVTRIEDSCPPQSGSITNNDPVCGGWGNHVVIQHDSEDYTQTLYAHLDYVNVKEGDKITKGQKIGVQGHTGTSSGEHLHFEVYVGSTDPATARVDPRDFVNFPAVNVREG